MKSLFAVIITCVLCVPAYALEVRGADVYGYGNMSMPTTQKDSFSVGLARVGVKVPKGKFLLRFEQDLAKNKLQYAYCEALNSARFLRGVVNMRVGYQLTNALDAYPGPQTFQLPITRYAHTLDDFTFCFAGVSAVYESGVLAIKAASFGRHKFMGSVQVAALSGTFMVNWEQEVGFHATAFLPVGPAHPFLGAVRYTSEERSGEVVMFVQEYIQLAPNVRLYGQYDFGDIKERLVTGLTYAWAADSFLKLYRDFQDKKFLAEVAYGF